MRGEGEINKDKPSRTKQAGYSVVFFNASFKLLSDEKFIMVPPSMIAACCVTAAVCGNEKFPKNTPEGILARMQAGIGVETVSYAL